MEALKPRAPHLWPNLVQRRQMVKALHSQNGPRVGGGSGRWRGMRGKGVAAQRTVSAAPSPDSRGGMGVRDTRRGLGAT